MHRVIYLFDVQELIESYINPLTVTALPDELISQWLIGHIEKITLLSPINKMLFQNNNVVTIDKYLNPNQINFIQTVLYNHYMLIDPHYRCSHHECFIGYKNHTLTIEFELKERND